MSQRITSEDQRTIKAVCPLFNRIAACYCNNPDYGVTLSPKAKRALNRGKKALKTQATKVISGRIEVDVAKRLNEYLKANGMTINDFINKTVKETVDEASVCEGLPREVSDL